MSPVLISADTPFVQTSFLEVLNIDIDTDTFHFRVKWDNCSSRFKQRAGHSDSENKPKLGNSNHCTLHQLYQQGDSRQTRVTGGGFIGSLEGAF